MLKGKSSVLIVAPDFSDRRYDWIFNKSSEFNYLCLGEKLRFSGSFPVRQVKGKFFSFLPNQWNLSRRMDSSYTVTSLIYLRNLEKYVEQVDLVVSYTCYWVISAQTVNCAQRKGKKSIVIEWETISRHISSFLPPYSLFGRYVAKKADFFVATTQRATNYLRSLGVSPGRIEVVYPSIDPDKFVLVSSKKQGGESVRILFVGRLTQEKGIAELLIAFERLFKLVPTVELEICGEGTEEKLVRSYQERLPIFFDGFKRDKELKHAFTRADIFCLPSKDRKFLGVPIWEEQFGFVLVEAMAYGLPIVTTNNGAIPEVVGGKNAVVRQGDSDALHKALLAFVKSDKLRREVATSNRQRVRKLFLLTKQSERMQLIFENILSSKT